MCGLGTGASESSPRDSPGRVPTIWGQRENVNGTVISVDVTTSSGGRRAATQRTVDYELGGGTIKRCQLNSRGIKMADAESTTGESNEPAVIAHVNKIIEHVNETINVGAPSVAGMTTDEFLLDTIESSDEEPETMTAAPAGATTVAATAGAADDCSTVATVHHVEWRRASSTEPSLNGNYTPRM